MVHRAYNFSAGPATIPLPVLTKLQEELLDWRGTGMSVMEISHRSQDYLEHVLKPAQANLRQLLEIPENYQILFITGGASHQFAMVPLNLMGQNKQADYLHTGIWSEKAIKEAQRYGDVNVAMSNADSQFTSIPAQETWQLNPKAAYVHYTPNETINGVEFRYIPNIEEKIPLVADMSSYILSRPINISKFGLIYAGAQKNIGLAGLTIVIIREELLGKAYDLTPTLYNYQTYAEHQSLYNTPATLSIYLANLVFEWIISTHSSLSNMAVINARKAAKLYNYIDSTSFYQNNIATDCRSIMNVVFRLPTLELDEEFVKEASAADLTNLKGHRLVGGIRASIYNAMPEAGVDALIDFMRQFMERHG